MLIVEDSSEDEDADSYQPDSESGIDDLLSDLSDFIDDTSSMKKQQNPPCIRSSLKDLAIPLNLKCPYIQYGYIEENQSFYEVDILVLTMSSKYFRHKMQTGGLNLEMGIMVPDNILNKRRLMLLKSKYCSFIDDYHQATSFKESTDNIQEAFNSPDELFGRPQVIKLIFKCKTHIVEWSVYPCDANSTKLANKMKNNRKYISILSNKVKRVKKPLEKKQKGRVTRGLSSPGFNKDTTESEQKEEDIDTEYKET